MSTNGSNYFSEFNKNLEQEIKNKFDEITKATEIVDKIITKAGKGKK